MNKQTPEIIATIGPASNSRDTILNMVSSGATMLRLNMSQGTHQEHADLILKARKVEPDIKILINLSGPHEITKSKTSPGLTPKDLHDLEFAAKYQASHISLSSTSSAEDIMSLKQEMRRLKLSSLTIAKIETQAGIDHTEEIIVAADSIMIGRETLTQSVGEENVPLVTLSIVANCKKKLKPCYVSTQILIQSINGKTPTKAALMDAWLIGYIQASGAMLSEETALGENPALAVQWLHKLYYQGRKDNKEHPFVISSSI